MLNNLTYNDIDYNYLQQYNKIWWKYDSKNNIWVLANEEFPEISGTIFYFNAEEYRIDEALDYFNKNINFYN